MPIKAPRQSLTDAQPRLQKLLKYCVEQVGRLGVYRPLPRAMIFYKDRVHGLPEIVVEINTNTRKIICTTGGTYVQLPFKASTFNSMSVWLMVDL